MIGAGTVINPIVKIVTTVAILAAVYFLILKPILNTTDHAIDSGTKLSNQINRQVSHAFDGIGGQQKQQVQHALKNSGVTKSQVVHITSNVPSSAKQQEKVLHCVERANGDVQKMQRCVQ